MNIVYFETNQRNGLIYILIHTEVKDNKMLFNSRDYIISVILIYLIVHLT